jgi:hypothetical protein
MSLCNWHTWDQASQASIKPPLDLLANLRLLSLACKFEVVELGLLLLDWLKLGVELA